MRGRPIKIQFIEWNGQERKIVESQASFHCWGFRKQKSADDKPKMTLMETVGVCELPTGDIRLVVPEKIKFLDKGATNGQNV